MTKIELLHKDQSIILHYDTNGVLAYVLNPLTDKKMMVEYTQVGNGYEFSDNNGYVPMSMCNAVYVRIMDLDLFVPKFLFILPKL